MVGRGTPQQSGPVLYVNTRTMNIGHLPRGTPHATYCSCRFSVVCVDYYSLVCTSPMVMIYLLSGVPRINERINNDEKAQTF